MEDWVGSHIACTSGSVSKRSSTIIEILGIVDNELHDILSSPSFPDDDLFDAGLVSPSRNVLLPPWINTAPDGGSLAVPASDRI